MIKINSGIYPFEAGVFYRMSREATVAELRRDYPHVLEELGEYEFLNHTSSASFYKLESVTLIWISDSENHISDLTHELLHFAIDTLKAVGIPLDDSSEEAYAYLLSYYIKQVLNSK